MTSRLTRKASDRIPGGEIPRIASSPKLLPLEDVEIYHLHIDPSFARRDINCLLPIQRLNELEEDGEIGSAAELHYSIMGYLPKPDEMLEKSVPAIIQQLKDEHVDVMILVPS